MAKRIDIEIVIRNRTNHFVRKEQARMAEHFEGCGSTEDTARALKETWERAIRSTRRLDRRTRGEASESLYREAYLDAARRLIQFADGLLKEAQEKRFNNLTGGANDRR